jgi:hypothetical protein
MGVAVDEIDQPLPESLARVDEAAWPDAGLHIETPESTDAVTDAATDVEEAAGEEPVGYLISHAADSAYTAMNRLLANGHAVHWLKEAPVGGAVGDIFVPAEGLSPDEMGAIADELRLGVRALETEPAGERLAAGAAKVGLFKPWVASMDEGWTRFLLENYEFPHVNLNNDDLKEGEVPGEIDLLLFPDVSKSIIEEGKPTGRFARFFSPLPPEYSGGIGADGGTGIVEWVRAGGTVVGLDSSTEYLIDLFELPARNVLDGVSNEEFDCPGSMLRILVDTDHPLGYGLRPEEAAYFGRSPAFRTSVPDPRFDRRVIARYPDHRDDMLVSGYLKGGEKLERRAAMVEFEVGEGRVILIGFRAQHRAQPHRTFKLLFNSLYELSDS